MLFNSLPLNTGGLNTFDGQIDEILRSYVTATTEISSNYAPTALNTTVSVTDTYTARVATSLTTAARISMGLSGALSISDSVTSRVYLAGSIGAGLRGSLTTAVAADTDIAAQVSLLGDLVMAVRATDSYSLALSISDSVASTVRVTTGIVGAKTVALVTSAAITDTYLPVAHISASKTSSVALDTDIAAAIKQRQAATSTIRATTGLAAALNLAASVASTVNASTVLVVADGITLVLNVDSGAGWFFENYDFNSIASVNGAYLGANSTGLYLLSGNDDDGDDIDASIMTGLSDLGTPTLKRGSNLVIDYDQASDLELGVIAVDQVGVKKRHRYTVPASARGVVKIGQGLVFRNRALEVRNKDGGDFTLYKIHEYVKPIDRRR